MLLGALLRWEDAIVAHGFRYVPKDRTHSPRLHRPCGHCDRFHPPSRCRPVSVYAPATFCWCQLYPEDPIPGTAVMPTAAIPLAREA